MSKEERKQLRKKLETRLLAGEQKSTIYAGYDDKLEADLTAVALAQIPTSENRKEFRLLNMLLIVLLGTMVVCNLTSSVSLMVSGAYHSAIFTLLIVLVYLFLLLLVNQFRGLSYPLVVIFGVLWGVLTLIRFDASLDGLVLILQTINIGSAITSTLLAAVLKRSLLPNSHFFVMPKRDGDGEPLFED